MTGQVGGAAGQVQELARDTSPVSYPKTLTQNTAYRFMNAGLGSCHCLTALCHKTVSYRLVTGACSSQLCITMLCGCVWRVGPMDSGFVLVATSCGGKIM